MRGEQKGLDAAGWTAVGAGAVLALVVLGVPFLRFALSYLTILIHELGHAIFGWLFGYPTIPAFDFRYGGGLAVHQSRSMLVLGMVHVALIALAAAYWRNRATLLVLGAGVGLYALCAHTAAHQVVILFMGHGFELAIAGVFLYRAFSGSAVASAAERPAYAACGFFIVFSDVVFAYHLLASPRHRTAYEMGTGGGHRNDFVRIATDFLHVDLAALAFVFLVCCVLTLALSFAAFRYREALFDRLAALVARAPA